ncbi:nitroreductase family protein, partial [Candidatus Hakubella thermalkaliphila]|uniref:nitroreductase family protein n=1 Tax=Candidatus Hakubella thermalkaliphila TaxID=2754717 RepID=UPI002158EBFC
MLDANEDRGIRYVHMEPGHVGQNVHLQAVALGLGTVVIGASRDDQVKEILKASDFNREMNGDRIQQSI